MTVSDEVKEFIDSKIEAVRQEAMAEQKKSIKAHFDYCSYHLGGNSQVAWLRNELFGKD